MATLPGVLLRTDGKDWEVKVMTTTKTVTATQLLLALAVWFLSSGPLKAQTAAAGWTVDVHATDVSAVNGGAANLAADLDTGDLFVKSLGVPSGSPVELAQVTPSGIVTILGTFSSLRNSHTSGIAIDPQTGGIIVADSDGAGPDPRIALIDLPGLSISTLFDIPWTMNPNSNGTGQQQYALDPASPSILYFWDSTLAKLFSLDRDTNTLLELLALDQATPVGEHISARINDIVLDPDTGALLLSDASSNSVLEVDPSTTPATVTTLFSGLPGQPWSITLDPVTDQVFLVIDFDSVHVGPRAGGSLSPVASGFSVIHDTTMGLATSGNGQIEEPEASQLLAASAEIRATINNLIANAS